MIELPKFEDLENVIGNLFILKNGDQYDYLELHGQKKISPELCEDFHQLRMKYENHRALTRKPYQSPKATDKLELKSSTFLNVQSMRDFMESAKGLPPMKRLFGDLWFSGDVCILFAGDGCGKTILAMQVAESLALGISVAPQFPNECEAMKVLYCDFELSREQHLRRYTNKETGATYRFSENLIRCEINVLKLPEVSANFEEKVISEVELTAESIGAGVVIIDNLTYLCADTEKGKLANRLMKQLKILAGKLNISLMVIGHPPKRDETKILSSSDLGGSKHLANFTDDMIALNKLPDDDGRRYLKHLKGRIEEKIYTTKNVLQCEIVQREDGFLMLQFGETADERSLLKTDDAEQNGLLEKAKTFLLEQLKNGAKYSEAIIREGKPYGIFRNKLYEAKALLGIDAIKQGKSWVWRYPNNFNSFTDNETENSKTLETVETFELGEPESFAFDSIGYTPLRTKHYEKFEGKEL